MRDRGGMCERETGRETVDGARRKVLQHATFTKRQTSMLFSMQGRTIERGLPYALVLNYLFFFSSSLPPPSPRELNYRRCLQIRDIFHSIFRVVRKIIFSHDINFVW